MLYSAACAHLCARRLGLKPRGRGRIDRFTCAFREFRERKCGTYTSVSFSESRAFSVNDGVCVKAIFAVVSGDLGKYCNLLDCSQNSRRCGIALRNQGRSLYRASNCTVETLLPCAAKKFNKIV